MGRVCKKGLAEISTTGSVSDTVERSLAKMAWDIPHVIINNYAEDDGYIQAMTNAIKAAGFGQQEGDRIIFSFHSLVKPYMYRLSKIRAVSL